MSKPQVITVAAKAGIGSQPAQQIPIGDGSAVTLVNLSNNLGLVLCDSSDFNITWPLNAATVLPQTGLTTLFISNPNSSPVQVEVLQGIVPVSSVYKPNLGGMLSVSAIVTYATSPLTLLPAPPVGFAYVVNSISFSTTAVCSNVCSQLLVHMPNIGAIAQKASSSSNVGFTFADTIPFNNLIINSGIDLYAVGSLSDGFQVQLLYSLISIT